MTSIACWVGVDTHGPASAYIASDSRISWGIQAGAARWDAGRKAFASSATPDIFGYSGDVLFPSLLLSQFVTGLEAGIFETATFGDRFRALEEMARITFETFPTDQRQPLELLHCGRDGNEMSSEFNLGILRWTIVGDWHREFIRAPETSSRLIFRLGSGKHAIAEALAQWEASSAGGTSRAVFSAFVHSLRSGRDPASGGPPQLVGLYRKGAGRVFGVVDQKKRYLAGIPVLSRNVTSKLEWRNEIFERCCGVTGARLPEAQRHRTLDGHGSV